MNVWGDSAGGGSMNVWGFPPGEYPDAIDPPTVAGILVATDQFRGKHAASDGLPAYSFNVSVNSGLNNPTNGRVDFIVTGSKRLRVSGTEVESTTRFQTSHVGITNTFSTDQNLGVDLGHSPGEIAFWADLEDEDPVMTISSDTGGVNIPPGLVLSAGKLNSAELILPISTSIIFTDGTFSIGSLESTHTDIIFYVNDEMAFRTIFSDYFGEYMMSFSKLMVPRLVVGHMLFSDDVSLGGGYIYGNPDELDISAGEALAAISFFNPGLEVWTQETECNSIELKGNLVNPTGFLRNGDAILNQKEPSGLCNFKMAAGASITLSSTSTNFTSQFPNLVSAYVQPTHTNRILYTPTSINITNGAVNYAYYIEIGLNCYGTTGEWAFKVDFRDEALGGVVLFSSTFTAGSGATKCRVVTLSGIIQTTGTQSYTIRGTSVDGLTHSMSLTKGSYFSIIPIGSITP